MGLDLAGHRHGGESSGYSMAARKLDMVLAQALPRWHAALVGQPDQRHLAFDRQHTAVPVVGMHAVVAGQ
ncbi:hypothetical protein ACIPDT_25810, partial [Escherichia coli]